MMNSTGSATRPPRLSKMEQTVLLEQADHFLQAGLDLRAWWENAFANDSFDRKFPLSASRKHADVSFGYFGSATVTGKPMKVMGNYQQMFFDQSKTLPSSGEHGPEWIRDQLKEFILRYFMRVSDFSNPTPTPNDSGRNVPPPFDLLSWCWKGDSSDVGFGFFELFTQKPNSSDWKEVPAHEQTKVNDLRTLGAEIEKMLLWVKIFDFEFGVSPLGSNGPRVSLPLQEGSYLIMSPEWVTIEDNPSEDILGHYGLGYSFAKEPFPSLIGYGPGEFEAAFEKIEFIIHRDGKIRVEMVFVSNLPDRILNVSLDPLSWMSAAAAATMGAIGPSAAPVLASLRSRSPLKLFRSDPIFGFLRGLNIATLGQADSLLCISKDQLLKEFLFKHFAQHFQTISGSLRTWRAIEDWTDESTLPAWVINGTSL